MDQKEVLVLVNTMFIFSITLYLSILAHECGHLFYFLWKKRPISYVYVVPFLFLPEKKRFRCKLDFSCLGLVVPMFEHLESSKEENLQQEFGWALLMGPVVNLVLVVGTGILWLVSHRNLYLYGVLINGIMVLMAGQRTGQGYGDLLGYLELRKNKLLLAQFVYSDCMRAPHVFHEEDRTYLAQIFVRELSMEQKLELEQQKRTLLFLMQEQLRGRNNWLNQEIREKIRGICEPVGSSNASAENKDALSILLQERWILYLVTENYIEKAQKLFEGIENHVGIAYRECAWALGMGNYPETLLQKLQSRSENQNFYQLECEILQRVTKSIT